MQAESLNDVFSLTDEFFKGAKFVINNDGTMNLTLVMDEELIAVAGAAASAAYVR